MAGGAEGRAVRDGWGFGVLGLDLVLIGFNRRDTISNSFRTMAKQTES